MGFKARRGAHIPDYATLTVSLCSDSETDVRHDRAYDSPEATVPAPAFEFDRTVSWVSPAMKPVRNGDGIVRCDPHTLLNQLPWICAVLHVANGSETL